MNRQRLTQHLLRYTRLLPFFILLVVLLLFGRDLKQVRVEDVLNYVPESMARAALAMLALYAVKSLSVVFPLLVLYLASGLLFPLPVAVAVNMAGLAVSVTLPYWLGRFSGEGLTQKLLERYGRAEQFHKLHACGEWFFVYIVRVIGLLPGDVVSMVLGSMRIPYAKYLTGSLAGLLPAMLATTLLGVTITDPLSPAFILSCVARVLVTAASLLAYRVVSRHMQNKQAQT